MGEDILAEVCVCAVIKTARLRTIEEKYIEEMWKIFTSHDSVLDTAVNDLKEGVHWDPSDSNWVFNVTDEYLQDTQINEKKLFDACLRWKSENVFSQKSDHIIFHTQENCLGVELYEYGSDYTTLSLEKFSKFVEVQKNILTTELSKIGLTENDFEISFCNKLFYF